MSLYSSCHVAIMSFCQDVHITNSSVRRFVYVIISLIRTRTNSIADSRKLRSQEKENFFFAYLSHQLQSNQIIRNLASFRGYFCLYHVIGNTTNQNTGKALYTRRYRLSPTFPIIRCSDLATHSTSCCGITQLLTALAVFHGISHKSLTRL